MADYRASTVANTNANLNFAFLYIIWLGLFLYNLAGTSMAEEHSHKNRFDGANFNLIIFLYFLVSKSEGSINTRYELHCGKGAVIISTHNTTFFTHSKINAHN